MRKKSVNTINSILKGLFLVSVFVASTFIVSSTRSVFAEFCSDLNRCYLDGQAQCAQLSIENNVSITSTTKIIGLYSFLGVNDQVYNANLDRVGLCSCAMIQDLRVAGTDVHCGTEVTDIISCEDLEEAKAIITEKVAADPGYCNYNDAKNGAAAGSLLGVVRMAFDTAATGDIPVSLAYYTKHNLQKIPVINQTAYAAQVTYPGQGLVLVLAFWEVFRNFAYAIMAVIMMTLGIMITMRKSVSPQVVVTVQNALPRVIISLFLITFSYPIGAVMVSAIKWLIAIVLFIFMSIEVSSDGGTTGTFTGLNLNFVGVFQSLSGLIQGVEGVSSIVNGTILAFITVIALVIAVFKALVVYMKMLVMIVFAPLQFAWAAIPGQEGVISDWFKKMASAMLAIPGIIFFILLGWYVFTQPLANPGDLFVAIGSNGENLGQVAIQKAFTIIVLPILATMIILQSLSVDKKLNEMFGIDSKKKR